MYLDNIKFKEGQETTDQDVFNLAEMISESIVQYNNWYRFKSGKAFLKKQEMLEDLEKTKLAETKGMIKILSNHFNSVIQDLEKKALMFSIVKSTAELEWGEGTTTSIDWNNKKVFIKNNEQEVELAI